MGGGVLDACVRIFVTCVHMIAFVASYYIFEGIRCSYYNNKCALHSFIYALLYVFVKLGSGTVSKPTKTQIDHRFRATGRVKRNHAHATGRRSNSEPLNTD